MYTIWYSTKSLADFILASTVLKVHAKAGQVKLKKLYESDANNAKNFHTMPNHLKRILYLDAPDIIIDYNTKPVLSLEVSTEAGTGHNAFQRFSRIAAALENGVPAFYVYPEAGYVYRKIDPAGKWDKLNPSIFEALEKAMRLYNIPALLYYFPSNFRSNGTFQRSSKGLIFDKNYPSCPSRNDAEMKKMFAAIDETLKIFSTQNNFDSLMGATVIQEKRDWMAAEFAKRRGSGPTSPVTATQKIKTSVILEYLGKFAGKKHDFGEMLSDRKETIVYQADAGFRGDPYPGALAALDYLLCRKGKTFEERNYNLVMVWGKLTINEKGKLKVEGDSSQSVNQFVNSVRGTYNKKGKILLQKRFRDLKGSEIPRYFMQVRFGSTFTKVKHIRVYSYFCDAILFPDGALWREG